MMAQIRLKTLFVWLASAGLVAFLTHPLPAQDGKPKHGGTLVFGLEKDASTLNPFVRMQSTDMDIRTHIYEPLLDTDIKGNIIPALAQSWEISKDGLNYTFRLRRGVKFHNGQEMTAEDVVWSANYSMNPKVGATGGTQLDKVKSVAALDRYAVRFTLAASQASFLSRMATLRPFPVVPRDSIPENAEKLSTYPPGTGPFAFKEWKPERELVLTRFRDYWQKGVPYLDEVVFKPVADPTVRFAAVRAGDLQMIERTPYVFVKKAETGEVSQIKATPARISGFDRLAFNVVEPPFNNQKLRLAVAYAIDKKRYLEGVYWGYGEPTDQRSYPGSPWFVKLAPMERDPAKVKSLLKEAGVGENFEFEILGRKGSEEAYQVLQSQLMTAGFKVKVLVLSGGAYQERTRSGEFQAVVLGGSLAPDPDDVYTPEYACEEEAVKAKKRRLNYPGYCNSEVDRLLEEAGKITDQKMRYELYSKVARILHEEMPVVNLALVPRFFTYNQKVKGFATDAAGRFSTTTFGMSRVWLDK
jgi:peptide/nickel transport system substrate-binding protein